MDTSPITIETIVNAPIEKVWEYWNKPEHIKKWAFASDDWEAPKSENDLRVGGKFSTTMAAKDGSESFEFAGEYSMVKEYELIEYSMSDPSASSGQDGRHVKTAFETVPDGVKIVQSFDPENENPRDMQKDGWQSILNNFKKYIENN